jgi:predicted nucleic acid-binding Zn ribbon protein
MPTYVYKCTECGYSAELERTIDRRGDKVFAPHAPNKKGCKGVFKQIITMTSTPFETLRDKGVFERIEKH